MNVFRTLHHVIMCFFLPLHHQLLTSTVAAVPRTLCQDIYTEAALRRWCSSNEALANSPSPIKTGIIRGVDAVRFTGLRHIVRCVPATGSLIHGFPRILVCFISTFAAQHVARGHEGSEGAGQETCCVRAHSDTDAGGSWTLI
jgi:hypothetical protein